MLEGERWAVTERGACNAEGQLKAKHQASHRTVRHKTKAYNITRVQKHQHVQFFCGSYEALYNK